MFESLASWLLLPLGVALGWYFARRSAARGSSGSAAAGFARSGAALGGEDPDDALGALLKATANDPASLELQLSLGTLFRRRGEVDRALRVHEALLERELTPHDQDQVRFELAEDYAKAGMMDRAEALFQTLASEGVRAAESLAALCALYEQGRDWQAALEANTRLEAASGQGQSQRAAQYCCELASQAQAAGDGEQARRWATRAAGLDPEAPRPWLLLAQIHEADGRLDEAAAHYERAIASDPRFLSEALEGLWRCRRASGEIDAFVAYLRESEAVQASSAGLLKQAELMESAQIDSLPFLSTAFAQKPSWALLERLCDKISLPADAPLAPALDRLREALRLAAQRRPRYRCAQCGLTVGMLFWQCPSCRRWGSIAPADDRIG